MTWTTITDVPFVDMGFIDADTYWFVGNHANGEGTCKPLGPFTMERTVTYGEIDFIGTPAPENSLYGRWIIESTFTFDGLVLEGNVRGETDYVTGVGGGFAIYHGTSGLEGVTGFGIWAKVGLAPYEYWGIFVNS